MSKKQPKKSPGKAGRPPIIDEAMRQQVLGVVGVGGSLRDAADIIGVDYKTLWVERKRNADFAKGVRKAIKSGKIRLVQKVAQAKPWQAAAWMLERKYGEEYGKRDRVDVTTKGRGINLLPIVLDGDKEV